MKYTHIHFVGIKGVGVAPLAIIAKEAGIIVTGCDTNESFITDQPLSHAGITPLVGFDPSHLENIDLVITTGAHGGKNNPEIVAAIAKGIPTWMQGEAVGEYMKGELFERSLKGISVAGCHGKTTTTAMIATIFKHARLDPSYLIGTGDIPSLGGSGHFGKGEYFIAEADEYATDPQTDKTAKFLWQHPNMLVITNIEYDHPDLYASFEQVKDAYKAFTKNIVMNGILFTNGDFEDCRKIFENHQGQKYSFGFNSNNDYVLKISEQRKFLLTYHGELFGEFSLEVPGEHNILNATAAIAVAHQAGLSAAQIAEGVKAFTGTKRRYEYMGALPSGAVLFDDYAHHPTEINATLKSLKAQFPEKKIVAIFQPHTYSRTKKLFDQFLCSFEAADEIILMDIYASKREATDLTVSSSLLARGIEEQGKTVTLLATINDVVQYVNHKKDTRDSVIVTMGAGDIYRIYEHLVFTRE